MTISQSISLAITALQAGKLIGYPTESVYGFGADPFNESSISLLQQLKARPEDSAFLMIAAHFDQIKQYIDCTDITILKKMTTITDHPTTWVCPASKLVPQWLLGPKNTIAIRITDFSLCVKLCDAFHGPIISTSANFKGQAPAKTYEEMQLFKNQLAYTIDSPCGTSIRPSTIKDLITDHIYRQ
jgi:L-threonylcarbamoyladenylate synthase